MNRNHFINPRRVVCVGNVCLCTKIHADTYGDCLMYNNGCFWQEGGEFECYEEARHLFADLMYTWRDSLGFKPWHVEIVGHRKKCVTAWREPFELLAWVQGFLVGQDSESLHMLKFGLSYDNELWVEYWQGDTCKLYTIRVAE